MKKIVILDGGPRKTMNQKKAVILQRDLEHLVFGLTLF